MDERAARAQRYRLLAEEIRHAADGMHADSRATLLRLANDYDLLARKLDAIDARIRKQSG
jgi:hypothetical protein